MYKDETPEQRKKRRHRQKRAVRALQAELGSNYTTALREYERLEEEAHNSLERRND